MNSLLESLKIAWALPYTVIGLSIGGIGLCTGGKARFRGRAIEFYEGGIKWFVTHLPGGQSIAMTLGHTVHGESEAALDFAHDHEMVHVRQFERWGPFMGPAYLLSSFMLWIMGRDPYRDNPFEREAYGEEGSEAIRLDSKYADAYNSRGVNLAEQGEAIADYTEAIRLDPQDAKAYYNRGFTWTNKGEYDKAISDYTEAIRLGQRSDNAKCAFYGRSKAWAGKREYDRAIADCSDAIHLDPQYADAYIVRGLYWNYIGEHDKAIADYNTAICIDPQCVEAYHNRGNTWVIKGKYRNAIADLTKAIRLDPQDPRAYNSRGIAWNRKGKYHKAIADYTEAIRLDPKSARRYDVLAWLLATCPDSRYRDGAKAVQVAEEACELTDYRDADSLCWLAAAHAEKGNFDEAVTWQLKALDLASADENAGMHMCLELYKDGKPYHEE